MIGKFLNKIFKSTNSESQSVINKVGNSNLIISAGMQRSGSTLLYNQLREILIKAYPDNLCYGYIKDIDIIEPKDNFLLKTHTLYPDLICKSSYIFYT